MRICSAVASAMESWAESLTSSTGLMCVLPLPSCFLVRPGSSSSQWSRSSERRLASALVLFVGAALGPGQVDSERLGGAEGVLVELPDLDLFARLVDDADVEAQRLHLLDEHLEALGDTRLGDVLALHDGLVHLHAAEDVVRLDREDLLEGIRRAVRLEGPHLHLAEALAPELRLPAQRLLGDHRVRARRAGVDLVVDEVGQLQDVDPTDRDRLGVLLARAPVVEHGLPVGADETLPVGAVAVHLLEQLLD